MKSRINIITIALTALLSACLTPATDQSFSASKGENGEQLNEGFYGFSPSSVSVVWSKPEPWASYNVFHNLGGIESALETLVAESRVINLNSNSFYNLALYGESNDGLTSNNSLLKKQIRTWPTFEYSQGFSFSEPNGSKAPYGLQLNMEYNPFEILAPGPGVTNATKVDCFFSDTRNPGASNPMTDPLAKHKKFLLKDGSLFIGIQDIEFLNSKLVNCRVTYADDTTSTFNQPKLARAINGGEYGNCPKELLQEEEYICDSFGLAIPGTSNKIYGIQGKKPRFEFTKNTCSWLKIEVDPVTGDDRIVGSPGNLDVGSCEYIYQVKSDGYFNPSDYAVINHQVTIHNKQPSIALFEKGGQSFMALVNSIPTIVFRERRIGDNHSTTTLSPTFGAVMDSQGVVTLDNYQLESTEEVYARNRSLSDTGGRYLLQPSTCSSHLEVGSGINGRVLSIDSLTGAISLQMRAGFYGDCELSISYRDGTGYSNESSNSLKLRVRVYPFNNAPRYIAWTGQNSDPAIKNVDRCGTSSNSFCYVNNTKENVVYLDAGGDSVSGFADYYKEDQDINSEIIGAYEVAPNASSTELTPDEFYLRATKLPSGNANTANDDTHVILFEPRRKTLRKVRIDLVYRDTGYSCTEIHQKYSRPSDGNWCDESTHGPLFGTRFLNQSFEIVIDEILQNLSPSLVSSQFTCVLCHANVVGDFITDFGLKFKGGATGSVNGLQDTIHGFRAQGLATEDAAALAAMTNSSIAPEYTISGSFYVPYNLIALNNSTSSDVNGYQVRHNASMKSDLASNNNSPDGIVSPWAGRPYVSIREFLEGTTLQKSGISIGSPGNKRGAILGKMASGEEVVALAYGYGNDIKDTANNGSGSQRIRTVDINDITQNDLKTVLNDRNLAHTINWNSSLPQTSILYREEQLDSYGYEYGLPTPEFFVRNDLPDGAFYSNLDAQGNNRTIYCFGDVMIKGDLLLRAVSPTDVPRIVTNDGGCRLYVDGQVGIYGAPGRHAAYEGIQIYKELDDGSLQLVAPTDNSQKHHLQIIATHHIRMNLGPDSGGVSKFGVTDDPWEWDAGALFVIPDQMSCSGQSGNLTNGSCLDGGNKCISFKEEKGPRWGHTGHFYGSTDRVAGGLPACASGTVGMNPDAVSSPFFRKRINYSRVLFHSREIRFRNFGDIRGSLMGKNVLGPVGSLKFIYPDFLREVTPFPALRESGIIPFDISF